MFGEKKKDMDDYVILNFLSYEQKNKNDYIHKQTI